MNFRLLILFFLGFSLASVVAQDALPASSDAPLAQDASSIPEVPLRPDPYQKALTEAASGKDDKPIEITADGENRFEGGIASANDNVIMKSRGDTVYCDHLIYNAADKTVFARGNVRIYSAEQIYRGDSMIYNFSTKEIKSADFRSAAFPAFLAGENITSPGLNHYRVHDGFFTTDNRQSPAFKLRANTIEIYPNDRVVFKNVFAYVGPVPIFWLPYYEQSLMDRREGYKWAAGYNGRFGAFFYNKYNFVVDPYTIGDVRLDLREKRGLGGGVDFNYAKNESNKAEFKGYYAHDELYANDDYPSNRYTDGGVAPGRYRYTVKERVDITPDLSSRANLTKLSDKYVTLDFFEDEYRQEVQPNNFVDVVQSNPTYSLSAVIRPRLNDFYETVERKPDVKLEFVEQKIFHSPVAYQSESSLAVLDRYFSTSPNTTINPNNPLPYSAGAALDHYEAYRYDTFHQFLLPKQYFNFLSVTPRLGIRGTYYSDDNRVINDSTPYGNKITDPRGRIVPNMGLEASFKVSRAWTDIKSKAWGIDGLRHVAEPFMDAQYIPTIIGARPYDIKGFDDRLVSTRLQPINFPSYNSIDSIDQQAVIRQGVRNKLQTQRDGKNVDLVDWILYSDIDLDQNFSTYNRQTFSDVFSDLLVAPVPWLYLRSESGTSVFGHDFTEFNNDITWQPDRSYRLRVGNRLIQNSVLFPNSNLYVLNNFYRLNEHWQFETNHTFEAETGRLQEQAYTVYRDLSAWQLALTFKEREVNNGADELVFFLSFTLKAFPNAELTTNSLK